MVGTLVYVFYNFVSFFPTLSFLYSGSACDIYQKPITRVTEEIGNFSREEYLIFLEKRFVVLTICNFIGRSGF